MIYIFIIILVVVFGLSKAICDISECCYSNSKLSKLNPLFWDKHTSWKNKWKNGDYTQGEKVLGSSTFLVWITDAWHLFNVLSYTSIFTSGILIASITNKIYYIILPFFIGLIIFEILYRYLKK